MTRSEIIETQLRIGTTPDGIWGSKSIAACKAHLFALMPDHNPWPASNAAALQAFYGSPGDESQLVNIPVEGLGVKYEGSKVKTVRCHAKVADSLLRVIKKLAVVSPEVLADYNGCFNFRRMRGGTSYSLHAYGAAIDFCAGTNGNHTSWPSKATMPLEVMEAFACEGWLSAGAFWGRDGMHHQATK
jgi:hypothetical protein